MSSLGIVVIGRNEGERLHCCLRSVVTQGRIVVYVDSGSTDGSVAFARSLGVEVVELDRVTPFTAARARNAGLAHLLDLHPELNYLQFVDGDCEMCEGWMERGVEVLASHPECAIVAGRLRERCPESSVYNTLCNLEWDVPSGEVRACGGIALMRVAAIRQVRGFREHLIAGEEPELCFRLRMQGWKLFRDSQEMAIHEASMHRFGQWWRRAARSGYASIEGAWMHRRSPGRYNVHGVVSILQWAVCLPLAACLLSAWLGWFGVLVLLLYPFQWLRVSLKQRALGRSASHARLYAFFILLGKFAQLLGILRWFWLHIVRRTPSLIEYK